VLGLVDDDHRSAVLENLVQRIREGGNRVTAGDVGFAYVVQSLSQADRGDVLYDMVCQSDGPGYLDQLRKGATSLTEAWDANPHSSHNHCMLGHAEQWFYCGLAGIAPDPAGPGFKQFLLRPQVVGDVTWVRAHYDSVHGRIQSHWQRADGEFHWEFTVPPNTTATVFVPAASAEDVRSDGTAVQRIPGVRLLKQAGGRVVLEVSPGHYRFQSPWPT
jgi:alpha-L-rhamnosidase